jgi:HAD superfamily hydrolase (TIGR01484 family)
MKKKVLLFDLDGTALDSPVQKLPTERLVRALQHVMADYYVCAATGRVWSFVKPILEELKLTDLCIISGGTQLCNPTTGEIVWQCNIDQNDLERVVAIARQFPNQKLVYNDHTDDDYLHGGIEAGNLTIDEPVYFFNLKLVPDDEAPPIVAEFSKIEGVICTCIDAQLPGLKDIHVTNRGATKEHAVTELLHLLHAKREDTIGVGDGHNDIHLFNAVAYRVAMDNAVDELKANADKIIGMVKDDGLAEYVESLRR